MSKKKPSKPPAPRQEPHTPRLLGKNGGYVQDPRYALGKMGRYAGVREYQEDTAPEPEPEAVDKETQKWITEEAKERFEASRPERSLAERVAELEGKVRRDQLAGLRRRVESLERAAKKAA